VRPLDELIYEQTARAMQIAGTPSAEVQKKVEELKAAFRRVRSGEARDDETVFFAPARYWRDLFRRDFKAELGRMKAPVLVLQGGKDIQVTRTDYDLVQKALAQRTPEERQSHWFPDLNHLMMRVEGESTGAEYGRASTVEREVVEAIAAWVKSR
jgi:pimeloyl-ACP methyl ester carboxylesterase